jgi:chromosome segregation ATPase
VSHAGREHSPSVDDLSGVVAELRAELESIRERELRRETRLAAFDQQVAQMEASLEAEVERLRSTGSAVDLITEHLRIAARELLTEREHMSGELDDLRTRLDAVGTVDLQPVVEQVDEVAARLAALPGRELRPLRDQVERLQIQVGSLPVVDLAPLEARVDELRRQVAEQPPTDLTPLQEQIAAVPVVDLSPLHHHLDRLRLRIDELPMVDLTSLHEHLDDVRQRVESLPSVDLGPLHEQIASLPAVDLTALHHHLDLLRQRIDALPVVDLTPVHEHLDQVRQRVESLPSFDLRPLHDEIAAIPKADLTPVTRELDRLRETVAALPTTDLTPLHDQIAGLPTVDLGPVTHEIDRLREAVAALPTVDLEPLRGLLLGLRDQLTSLPRTDLGPLMARMDAVQGSDESVRDDLRHLDEQLDSLRTALADRFDAIPQPDLRPVLDEVSTLTDEVRARRSPDLTPIDDRLARLDDLVSALPRTDEIGRVLAVQAEAIREADRSTEVLGALDDLQQSQRVDDVLAAIDDIGTSVHAALAGLPDPADTIAPLRAQLDTLVTNSADARSDVGVMTHVLTDLTQLAEALDRRLGGVEVAQHAATTEQRALLADALGDLGGRMESQVHKVEGQLGQLVERAEALNAVEQELVRAREALGALSERVDSAETDRRSTADAQALAAAQVTAAVDGLSASLGSLRGSVAASVKARGEATVDAVDERVARHLAATTERLRADLLTEVQAQLTAASEQLGADVVSQVQAQLADLGISQLRRSVSQVSDQVVGARADHRSVADAVAALDTNVTTATNEAVAAMARAIDDVRSEIEALPQPDLEPVAAQLARLSATVVSQARNEVATPGDLAELRDTVDDLMEAMAKQLRRQSDALDSLWAHVAQQPTDAQRMDDLRRELERTTAGVEAALDRMAGEVATAREAMDRRSGSRWRRGGGEAAAAPPAATRPGEPSELEQRLDQVLAGVDDRLSSLAQAVERATAFADDAARASAATLKALSTSPTPANGGTPARPAAKRAATKPRSAAAGTKSQPGAKAPRTTKKTAAKSPAKTANGSSGD